MPLKDPKNMTFAELKAEFKSLADTLQPLNARRKLIADELSGRGKQGDAANRLAALNEKQRRGLYIELSKEFEP